jgi:hypothetical protein
MTMQRKLLIATDKFLLGYERLLSSGYDSYRTFGLSRNRSGLTHRVYARQSVLHAIREQVPAFEPVGVNAVRAIVSMIAASGEQTNISAATPTNIGVDLFQFGTIVFNAVNRTVSAIVHVRNNTAAMHASWNLRVYMPYMAGNPVNLDFRGSLELTSPLPLPPIPSFASNIGVMVQAQVPEGMTVNTAAQFAIAEAIFSGRGIIVLSGRY